MSWDDLEEVDYDAVPKAVAEEEFVRQLVELKLTNILSAKQVCSIAFWATKAGLSGPASKLALRPDSQTGKFSRKFDTFLGSLPSDVPAYEVPTVLRPRTTATRVVAQLPVMPPHESLLEELDVNGTSLAQELRDALDDDEMPPFYTDHPAVIAAPPDVLVHPAALYMDGVAFQRQDSVLGIWAHLLFSKKRHLLVVIRRSEMCTCGCRGWCTLQPVMTALAWSFRAMCSGTHPARRHDEQTWRPGDSTARHGRHTHEPLDGCRPPEGRLVGVHPHGWAADVGGCSRTLPFLLRNKRRHA